MSLFQQSTITFTDAKAIVTGSAGTVTDTALTKMGAIAICQAIEKWNAKRAWNFLTTTAPTFSIDPSLGADYLLPPDFSGAYSARTTTTNKRNLIPVSQREYDWFDPYGMTGTALYYSPYIIGTLGKVRFHPTPSVYDTVVLKYYRKMSLPMASTTTLSGCTCSTTRTTFAGIPVVSGSRDVTVSSTSGLYVGEKVDHDTHFITAGTTISDIKSSTVLTLSAAATGSGTGALTIGSTIMTVSSTNGIRAAAGVSGTGIASGTTVLRVLDGTTIQLSAPITAAISSVTFSSEGQFLDIPADYERGILSLAKYYYLRDKGGDEERIKGWKQEGQEAFQEAIANDNTNTDDQQGFQPGYLCPNTSFPSNPNDIRWAYTDW